MARRTGGWLALAMLLLGDTATAVDLERLQQGRVGDEHRFNELVLEGDASPASMHLREVQAWTKDAVVVVHSAGGRRTMAPPSARYFLGALDSEAGSRVMLRISASGAVRALVATAGGVWVADEPRPEADLPLQAKAMHRLPGFHGTMPEFSCQALDPHQGSGKKHRLVAADPAHDKVSSQPATWRQLAASPGLQKGVAGYMARVAVETDHEYFALHGNASDAAQYMADVFAFISGIYESEVDTSLALSHLALHSDPADPWAQTSTDCALREVGKFWNENRGSINRTITHFVSGKPMGGGIAWLGVLCEGAFGVGGSDCPGLEEAGNFGGAYGVSGGLLGNFDAGNPGVVWDMVVIAHEIGHNFDSPHTHCYGGIGGNAAPVDQCSGGDVGAGCYSGAGVLPGPAGQGSGTLMSYCHLLAPGLSNVSATFGTGHAFGVEPGRVPTRMSEHVVARATQAAACLDPQGGFRISAGNLVQRVCSLSAQALQPMPIQVAGFGGFAAPVSLAFDPALPAGFNGVLPSPVTPGSAAQAQLGIAQGTAAGSYSISIVGNAAPAANSSVTASIEVSNTLPVAPVLSTPVALSSGQSTRPAFQWQPSAGAITYQLEVARDAAFTDQVLLQTTTTNSHALTPAQALALGTDYFWRVRSLGACGMGSHGEARSFRTANAVGQCGAGQQVQLLLSQDFESGAGGWTSNQHGGTDAWMISSVRAAGGSQSIFSADVDVVSDRQLSSPVVNLPGDLSAMGLRFQTSVNIESAGQGCFDGGVLEISTDGGANYGAIAAGAVQQRPFDGAVANGFDNPLTGRPAWCGARPAFERYSVDLSAYAGQSVRLRFRLGTDNAEAREGWYVDDIEVLGCKALAPGAVFGNGFEG